jgi:Spy/CpxP family protein refolding chaperone
MKTNLTRLILLLALALSGMSVYGQDETPQPGPTPDVNKPNQQFRIMRELGLTQDQVQQIRRINAQRREITQEAQTKLREATRALDTAIYSENVSEEEVKLRMRDVQLAQAEMIKVKTMTEYMIRKVLTPEQLEKFRQLRERLMNRQNQPKGDQTRPADRIRDRRMQRPIE